MYLLQEQSENTHIINLSITQKRVHFFNQKLLVLFLFLHKANVLIKVPRQGTTNAKSVNKQCLLDTTPSHTSASQGDNFLCKVYTAVWPK